MALAMLATKKIISKRLHFSSGCKLSIGENMQYKTSAVVKQKI